MPIPLADEPPDKSGFQSSNDGWETIPMALPWAGMTLGPWPARSDRCIRRNVPNHFPTGSGSLKFEGDAKVRFQKLHKILSEEALLPRQTAESYNSIGGENEFEFQVGEGPKITWGELSAGFIARTPARAKRLLECIRIAELLPGISLPKELE